MKRIYTALGIFALTTSALAQTSQLDLPTRSVDRSTSVKFGTPTGISPSLNINHAKSVLLDENFENVTAPALPAGWSVETQATGTTTAAGGNTAGTVTGYAGFYTGDHIDANAATYWPVPNVGSGNFAMANDDVAGDFLCAERLITPMYDFSAEINMSLSFDIYNDGAYGSGDASIDISEDGGVTWTQLSVLATDASNWQHYVIDLIAYNNAPNVTLSFVWNDGGDCSTAGDNWGTGIAVDNVFIETIPENELTSNWLIGTDINADYEYSMLPLMQARPLGYTMSISNNGLNDQADVSFDYDVSLLGSSVDAGSASTTKAITSLSLDTIIHQSTFTPSTTGVYTLSATATMDSTEVNPLNNTDSVDLEITNYTWGRDNNVIDGGFYNIGGADGAGVKLGHVLFATADQVFYSISIGILGSDAHDGKLFYGELYYYDAGAGAYVYLNGTAEYTINNAVLGGDTIISLPFFSGGAQVTAGMDLLVVACHYGGAADASDHVRFATAGPARDGLVLGFDGTGGLFNLTNPPAIVVRLNGDITSGIEEEEVNTSLALGQNIPNPANNTTAINYTVKSNANVTLTVTDMSGKVVMTVNEGTKSAGDYKITLDASTLAGGMYHYTLSNGETSITKAMSVVK